MDLEKVALEAVKIKIQEIFEKIYIETEMDGKIITIRIILPPEIMNDTKIQEIIKFQTGNHPDNLKHIGNLDKEAQAAADELLGTNPQGE